MVDAYNWFNTPPAEHTPMGDLEVDDWFARADAYLAAQDAAHDTHED